MADINLDPNYFDHIKTKRLVRCLGKGAAELPLRLWCYTHKHYQADGRLVGHTSGDIEAAVDWWGDEGKCVEVLLDLKFLDRDGETFVVHGWTERNGHLAALSERGRKAAMARWGRIRDPSPPDATSNASACTSIAPTQPAIPTIPTKPANPPSPAVGWQGAAHCDGLAGRVAEGVLADAKRRQDLSSWFLECGLDFNASTRQNWLDRRDVSAARLQRELASIRGRPDIIDAAAVLVSRINKRKSA